MATLGKLPVKIRIEPEPPDDRHTCAQCWALQRSVCTKARIAGVVDAQPDWRPSALWLTTPHRCAGFMARTKDAAAVPQRSAR